jgi:hypothetical protein
MRTPVISLVLAGLAGCGGHSAPAGQAKAPEIVGAYTAAAWVPANPTYVIAAHTFRDGQRALRDLSDSFGMVADVDAKIISQASTMLLAVDALSPDAVANIGIDLEGGLALFSEDINPTFVAHLTSPEQMQLFLEQQRQHGLVTTSVFVDGAEVFTAKLGSTLRVGWAIDKDWLWLHFSVPIGKDDGAAWFAHSHHPGGTGWVPRWSWARAIGNGLASHAPSVVGFVDVRELVMGLAEKLPHAMECAKLVQPIGNVGIALEGDLHHAGARLAIDLGPAAASVASHILQPPPGWAQASAKAPLAIELNLDMVAITRWIAPCAELVGENLDDMKQLPVRTARVMIQTLDPDDKSGTGAASADIDSPKFFEHYLDKIPMRSHFEDDRTYGGYAGKALSIPFGPKLDYVLTEHVVLAGMGDGMLAGIAAGPAHPGPPAPLFAISLIPTGLSAKAWEWLLDEAGIGHAKRVAERLVNWRDGHVRLGLEGNALVLEASGNHR